MATGNVYTDAPGTHPAPFSGNRIGTGSPEGVVTASPGDYYFDSAADQLYIKETGFGTNTGWTLVAGGGGGTTQVYGGASDPNGVQSATGPAVYIKNDGTIWVKPSGSTGNTGWI